MSSMDRSITTGVIGLGAMGVSMASNLEESGLLAMVWSRTSARAFAFAVMVGGESANIVRIMPILEVFSTSVTRVGSMGSGQVARAVNQVLITGTVEAVCEALALAEKLNRHSERLLSVIGAGVAGSWYSEHRGKAKFEDSFYVGFKLSSLLRDLTIFRALAQELDVNMPRAEATIRDYCKLVELGDGDNDISGLIRLKRGTNTIQCEH